MAKRVRHTSIPVRVKPARGPSRTIRVPVKITTIRRGRRPGANKP